MRTKLFFSRIAVLFAILFGTTLSPMTLAPMEVAANEGPTSAAPAIALNQANCLSLAQEYANVAHPENQEWLDCFTAGWLNWVFSASRPIPTEPPQALKDALEKGYVQLTEPWAPGCDNTIEHPKCGIGFLKLFNDWAGLRAFLAKGEFTQKGISKTGPWSNGSLWFTTDYVQLMENEQLSDTDQELFSTGAVWLAFALDGEYVLPATAPITGTNTYALRETWRGGCIGDQLPDNNCNVGEVKIFTDWGEILKYLKVNNWTRGSVCANCKIAQMDGLKITPLATPTNTSAYTPTNTPTNGPTSTPTNTPTKTPTKTNTPGGPTATPGPSNTPTTVANTEIPPATLAPTQSKISGPLGLSGGVWALICVGGLLVIGVVLGLGWLLRQRKSGDTTVRT